jgi:hypothetical protein
MSREALNVKIAALEKESARLAAQSYSQSNPAAVMERRDVARDLRKAYRQLEELNRPHVCKECTVTCTPSLIPQATAPEH